MKVNGNLQLVQDTGGVGVSFIQNAVVERFSNTAILAFTTSDNITGRLVYNTTSDQYMYYNGAAWTAFSVGGGTVTSVDLTAPSFLTVSGNPVTSTGTLALDLATQTANTVFAGPGSGADTAPTFRALVAADVPAIDLTSGVTGTLPIANGGTGQTDAVTAFTALAPVATDRGTLLSFNSSSGNYEIVTPGTAGQLLQTNTGALVGVSWTDAPTLTPAGSNTQIQYNNSGAFGASSKFIWNDASNFLALGSAAATTSYIALPPIGSGTGGALNIRAGFAPGAGDATTSQIQLLTNGDTGLGGGISIQAGSGSTDHNGGDANVNAGNGNGTGVGGNVKIFGGVGVDSGIGGSVVFGTDAGGTTLFTMPPTGDFQIGTDSGTAGQALVSGGAGAPPTWADAAVGSVTSVSVVTANGVSGSVATDTTTPAITLVLGDITPDSVVATGTVTASNISGTTSGTNTGDQTITLTGDVTGTGTGSFATTLASVGTPVTDSFVRITTDAKGRVTATSAADTSDVTTALGYTPVNKAGDTMSGNLDMGTNKVVNLGAPTADADAATKAYVDATAAGLTWKTAVVNSTTADLNTETGDTWTAAGSGVGKTLTSSGATATLDSVAVVNGNRVLVKNQTAAKDNGIYLVSGVGSAVVLTRTTDFDATTPVNEINGAAVFVELGTINASSGWTQIDTVATIDTDPIAWAQFSQAGSGVASITASTGISVDHATGAVTITNTGVTSAVAGTGIGVSGATGAVTFSNTGVLSVTGTTDRVTAGTTSGAAVIDIAATYVGQASITTLGTVTTGTWNATAVAAVHGGTGQTAYTVGDLLVADSTTTVAKLGVGAAGTVLHGGTTPSYGAVDLTADVTGTLPVANGGTGLATVGTAGQSLVSDGSILAPVSTTFFATGNFVSGTPSTITHNLGQQFVNVQVYADAGSGTFEQIIPQAIILADANSVSVTVNAGLTGAYVVITGVAGVTAGSF